jgi:hypothetical protein
MQITFWVSIVQLGFRNLARNHNGSSFRCDAEVALSSADSD